MKTTLLALLLTVCAYTQVTTASTGEQDICTPNPDTCPGGHPINPKQYTVNQLKRAATTNGVTITATPVAACNAISCWATGNWNEWDFVRADCYDFTAVAWCDFQECNGIMDPDGTLANYECHDLPPLELSAGPSVIAPELCQDGHDCSHLPPTCAELGCPYAPSGTSWTWTSCPQSQQLCWCWANTGYAQQCAHFTD